jgi:hypothetical protein
MRYFPLIVATVLLAACAPPGDDKRASQPPSEESVRQYLELTGANKLFEAQFERLTILTKKFSDIPDETWEKVMPKVDYDDHINDLIAIYQESLTQGDIDAAIAFYSTNEGQKIIGAQPAILQKSAELAWDRSQLLLLMVGKEVLEAKLFKHFGGDEKDEAADTDTITETPANAAGSDASEPAGNNANDADTDASEPGANVDTPEAEAEEAQSPPAY